MMGATTTTLFRFLLILLIALSNLISCFQAVPLTRTESLIMQASQLHLIHLQNNNNLKGVNERKLVWEEASRSSHERMDLQLQDYAPPGANGHHTPPKAP